MSVDDVTAAMQAATDLEAAISTNGRTAEPLPLDVAAPEFPLDVLPDTMAAYVDAAARSLTVPAEMVAMPMLALAGALIGNRLYLVLKASWCEYPTLFVAVVAKPGTAKTPALNLASRPLDALQDEARKAYQAEREAHESALEAWRGQDVKARGPKPSPPKMRHYFTADVTIEALVGLLADAPGLAIIRDEIGGWVASMDQYRGGKGSDRQQFLSLWSAQTIKADRKTGESVYARHPVACVVGGIQPDLAGELHDAAQRRDGFVERILPIVPDVGVSRWTDDAPNTQDYRNVADLFATLDSIEGGDGIAVHLSPEARRLFTGWHDENATIIESADGLAAGFFAKLPAHVARFALILHALGHADDPRPMVSADTMEDAIDVGEFMRWHIGRFLKLLHAAAPSATAGIEARVLRQLRKMRNANDANDDRWVSRSTIYRGLRNVTPDDLTATLNTLLSAGTIEHRTIPSMGTKPIDEYRIRISHLSHLPDPTDEAPPTDRQVVIV